MTRTSKASSYAIVASAKPVKSTTAGTTYTADGRYKAPTGKTLCLKLKETGSASSSKDSRATGPATGRPSRNCATRACNRDALTFTVRQTKPVAGDSFVVDNLSVAVDAGVLTPPGSLHASASSSTEST